MIVKYAENRKQKTCKLSVRGNVNIPSSNTCVPCDESKQYTMLTDHNTIKVKTNRNDMIPRIKGVNELHSFKE